MTHFKWTTLRQFYILILSFFFQTTFGQTSISWTNLAGNWQIVKEGNINKGDTAAPWIPDKSIIYSFDLNSKFIDKTSTANTVFAGNYNVDKVKKRISFSNIVQTTKFPGTTNKDFVNPAPRPDIFITKLTADTLIYYSKGCDEVDNSNCFSYTYLRKVK